MPKVFIITLSIIICLIIIGTIATLLAGYSFNKRVAEDVQRLFSSAGTGTETMIITEADAAELPPTVQKWLKYSQVIGKEEIRTVRSQQKAKLRLKPEGSWMSAQANYYHSALEPGFVWQAKIKAAPFIHIAGRDMYQDGRGNMLIKIQSMKTVADARGPEIDQGSLLRYLAEAVWYPTFALSKYVTWDEVDPHSARATMSYKGVTASGVFKFNDRGEVTSFEAERYMERQGNYSLAIWSVLMTDYKEFDGILAPSRGEVVWKLKSGDFNWYQFEVEQLEFNNPTVY